ncbi:hypothetical protein [Streptomyces sp. SAS_276]|uniref:hypothetical protein n=1 Tax=Streptomyces sp. SAS_276 TaxID=3412745 RepID=UPI00403C019C
MTERRPGERRGRFLDAVLRLFGGGPGHRGTTVPSISKAAGRLMRRFYEEFRTLEDVLAARIRRSTTAVRPVDEALRLADAGPGSGPGRAELGVAKELRVDVLAAALRTVLSFSRP